MTVLLISLLFRVLPALLLLISLELGLYLASLCIVFECLIVASKHKFIGESWEKGMAKGMVLGGVTSVLSGVTVSLVV